MIRKFEQFENNELSKDDKIQYILDNDENPDNTSADYEDLAALNDNQLDKYYNNVLRSAGGVNESDGSTTAVMGSGTAVGGGASGSYTSAMGTSVSGGDSGSAFASNSSVSGMGPIVSAQPSNIPGDVAGSTKGSGDIGSRGGMHTKGPAGRTMKNKKKAKQKRTKAINKIDDLYTTNYKENNSNGRIIQSWKTFNEEYTPILTKTIESKLSDIMKYINSENNNGSHLDSEDVKNWSDDRINEYYDSIFGKSNN